MNVKQTGPGAFVIVDDQGTIVEGPFETNAAAWTAIDRLDGGSANAPPKQRHGKPVLWGDPDGRPKKTKRQRRQAEREFSRTKKAAAKAPTLLRDIAAATFDPAGRRAYRDFKLGTFGPASEVRRIDPAVYLAEKAAKGKI